MNCHTCIRRGSPFVFETDWELDKKSANNKFQKRLDSNVVEFRRTKGHGSIIDGYYSAHESRFESYAASGFCGGAVQGPTGVTSLMRAGTAEAGFPATSS